MIKTFVTILLCTIATITGFSQENVSVRANLEVLKTGDLNNGSGAWLPARVEDKTITGNKYLFDSWTGIFKVIKKDGSTAKIFNLNYNLKNKNLESVVSQDSVFQYDTENIDAIVANNKTYKFVNNNEVSGLLLQVYNSEKIKLYKQFTVYVQEGAINQLTQEKFTQDRYVKKSNYFIAINDKFIVTKTSRKEILKHLESNKDALKKFASDNNLDFENEDDLARILNYQSTL